MYAIDDKPILALIKKQVDLALAEETDYQSPSFTRTLRLLMVCVAVELVQKFAFPKALILQPSVPRGTPEISNAPDALAAGIELANSLPFNGTTSLSIDLSAIDKNAMAIVCTCAKSIVQHLDTFDPRIFGYMYQLATTGKRKSANKVIQTADKRVAPADSIAFTKLYTPAWIVDFLLNNTLVPQLVTGDTSAPSQLRILDPSCGSGHFLLRAMDVLVDHYANSGISRRDAASMAISQLHGADIDSESLWICAFSLALKLLEYGGDPQQVRFSLEDTSCCSDGLGSLSKELAGCRILKNKFDIVITNPPYIGRRLIDRKLKTALKKEYPEAAADLSTAFLEAGLSWLTDTGRLGFITQSSILYLSSFEKLRERILDNHFIEIVCEVGSGAFPLVSGEKVTSAMIVISNRKGQGEYRFKSISKITRQISPGEHLTTIETMNEIRRTAEDFRSYRNKAFDFRCPPFIQRLMRSSRVLGNICEVRQGLATTDNARFIKNWWETDPHDLGKRFRPYVKGAGSDRWYSPVETVVDWGDDGQDIKKCVAEKYSYLKGKVNWVVKNEQFYFLPGLTFSFVSNAPFAARLLPEGCIFDVGGSAIFPSEEDRYWLLAYLNSSFVQLCTQVLNPTINMQVGDLKDLPLPHFTSAEKLQLRSFAVNCSEIARSLIALNGQDYFLRWEKTLAEKLKHKDPRIVFQELSNLLSSQSKKLQGIENEIDELVLNGLLREGSLHEKECEELQHLCKEARASRPAIDKFPETEKELATAVLGAITTSNSSGARFESDDDQFVKTVRPWLLDMLAADGGTELEKLLHRCLKEPGIRKHHFKRYLK